MRKLLYVTVWDFSDADSNGICKKILAQVKTLENMGFLVDFAYTKSGEIHLKTMEEDKILGKVPNSLNIILAYKIFAKKIKTLKYDAVYIRHSVSNPCYIHLLSVLRKKCSKIVVELPTYPYDSELKGDLKLELGGLVDKITRKKMKKYVDRIVTYSDHDSIFDIQTIKTINGIDFSSIPIYYPAAKENEINLLAVAMLSPWHGYDRIIAGMYEYYKNTRGTIVKFHIVGSGKELANYQELVKKWNLQSYVKFYGNKSGKDLDEIYKIADIAVSSLGLHRIGLNSASTLKDREYGARGLVIISSHRIDFLDETVPYVYYVPSDESPVNIKEVVKFYKEFEEKNDINLVRKQMREITKKSADMLVTFQPIKEFYLEEK